jgi:hypothetical protein
LEEGENVIDFEMRGSQVKRGGNIITLKFKYHLPFGFVPYWKTGALLEKIEID